MFMALPQVGVVVVDSQTSLLSLLDKTSSLPIDPPSLYLDLEGIQLGRKGSISIISLYIAPTKMVYLIDIHVLGAAAFSITSNNSTSLKTILESAKISKVFFDIRNDSDVLFAPYQISVAGIKDLQLMELATRKGPIEFVSGLSKCIDKGLSLSDAMKAE
jgi:exonuclease 3'-5' domain-containing protein 1